MAFLFGQAGVPGAAPEQSAADPGPGGDSAARRADDAWASRWSSPPCLLMAVCTLLPVGLLADHAARGPLPAAGRSIPRDVDGIVVLGGGIDGRVYRGPRAAELRREHGAVRRHPRAGPALFRPPASCSPAVPRGTRAPTTTTEAAVVGRFLAQQGMPDGRVDAGGSCPLDPGQRAAYPAAGAPAPGRALAAGHLGHAHAALDRRVPPRRLARAAALAGRLSNHRQAGSGRRAQHGCAARRNSIRRRTSGTGCSTIGC